MVNALLLKPYGERIESRDIVKRYGKNPAAESELSFAIAFDCGESDFFIEVNRALHARLLSLGIDHDFTTRPGGHTDQYWSNSLDYQLLFFQKFFNPEKF